MELRNFVVTRTRLGIAVGSDRVRAVAVRRGHVIWALEADLDEGEALDAAIASFLSHAPLRGWPRPQVVAAIGPTCSQVKRLVGLPLLHDVDALRQIVHASIGRFFLKSAGSLVPTGVAIDPSGGVWAGALEQPVIEAIQAACRSLRLHLEAVVPSTCVIGAALEHEHPSQELTWSDGSHHVRLAMIGRRLGSLRRIAVLHNKEANEVGCNATSLPEAAGELPPRPVAALASLGEHAWRFADSYGAAVLQRDEPLTYRPQRAVRSSRSAPRWRIALAASCCVLAVLLAAAAPILSAMRAERAAVGRLAALAGRRQAAAAAERELASVTTALGEVASFAAPHRSAVLLLAALARELPEGSALVTLRVDSTGGSLVALCPRAGPLLSRLEHVPGLVAPEIVGPVTRELTAAKEMERVTVRFGLAAPVVDTRETRQ